MTHTREVRGWCRACIEDTRLGGDWHICGKAEPAEGSKFCAWCGHEVSP